MDGTHRDLRVAWTECITAKSSGNLPVITAVLHVKPVYPVFVQSQMKVFELKAHRPPFWQGLIGEQKSTWSEAHADSEPIMLTSYFTA